MEEKKRSWTDRAAPHFKTVVVALLSASSLYWGVDARLTSVEKELRGHQQGFSHGDFVAGDRIQHAGLHIAVDNEIRTHFAELHKAYEDALRKCITEFQWQRLFDLNPQLRNPDEHP